MFYERGITYGHLDPYCIRVAMYGFEQIMIKVPTDASISPYATGKRFGLGRSTTDVHNTSVSAVAVLGRVSRDEMGLTVFHNRYAAIPLDPAVVLARSIPQFRLADAGPGEAADWEAIE